MQTINIEFFSTEDVIVYPNTEPEIDIGGIEIQILREFANHYNITLNFTIERQLWGDIYSNGTGTGMLGNMLKNRVDACIGKEMHFKLNKKLYFKF